MFFCHWKNGARSLTVSAARLEQAEAYVSLLPDVLVPITGRLRV
jgi:hypothetical protein